MVRTCLCAGTGLACAALFAAQNLSPLEAWGRLSSVTGAFTQVKTLGDLDVRLVSHGDFSFKKGRLFEWRVRRPVPSSFVATPQRYVSTAAGRAEKRELDDLKMSAALKALIAGDLSALDAVFAVEESAGCVALKPRTKELAAVVSEIRLEGGACLERARLRYVNGDALEIELRATVLPPSGAPPTERP